MCCRRSGKAAARIARRSEARRAIRHEATSEGGQFGIPQKQPIPRIEVDPLPRQNDARQRGDAIQTVLAERDFGTLAMLREQASHRVQSLVRNSRHGGVWSGTADDVAASSQELPL